MGDEKPRPEDHKFGSEHKFGVDRELDSDLEFGPLPMHALCGEGNLGDTLGPSTPVLRTRMTAAEPDATLSQYLPQRFRVERVLGSGVYGVVFLAHDSRLKRNVAIKILRSEWMHNPATKERFLRESRAAARLNHSHIVRVLEADENEAIVWQVCDVVIGATLSQHLKHASIAQRTAARFVEELADAVDYAYHAGVFHRDIKPDNVLIDAQLGEDLEHSHAYLTDFGMAKIVDDPLDLSRSGIAIGTPRYMAPEQFDGNTALDQGAADIYSLGTVLYECLTGHYPFRDASNLVHRIKMGMEGAPSPRDIIPSLSRDLNQICCKAMDPRIALRYRSARALADDLRNYLAGLPIHARPIPLHETLRRLADQNRLLVTLMALVPISLAVLVGVLIRNQSTLDQQYEKLHRANELLTKEKSRVESLMNISETLRLQADTERERFQEIAWGTGIREAYRAWENGRWWDTQDGLQQLLRSHAEESNRFEWRLLQAQVHTRVHELLRLDVPIHEVRLLPDSQRLAAVAGNGHLYVVDLASGKQICDWDSGLSSLNALAVHPNGEIIALGGSRDREVDASFPILVQWAEKSVVRKLDGLAATIESMEFSLDGEWLLCGSRYEEPKLIRIDGSESIDFDGQRRNTWLVSAPLGSEFFYQESPNVIRRISSQPGVSAQRFDVAASIRGAEFVVSGTAIAQTPYLAVAVANQKFGVAIIDTQRWQIVGRLAGVGRNVRCLVASPDGTQVVAGLENGECVLWDVSDEPWWKECHAGATEVSIEPGIDDTLSSELRFDPKGLSVCEATHRWQVAVTPIHSIAIAPDRLLCATEDGRLLGVAREFGATKLPVGLNPEPVSGPTMWETAWLADGAQLALRNLDGTVVLLPAANPIERSVFTQGQSTDRSPAARVLTPLSSNPLSELRVDEKELSEIVQSPVATQLQSDFPGAVNVRGLVISPDGHTLAWPADERTIHVHRMGSQWSVPYDEDKFKMQISLLGISCERGLIALKGPGPNVQFLEMQSPFGKRVEFTLPGTVSCMDWNPDGKSVLVGGNFGSLIECNLLTGEMHVLTEVESETFCARYVEHGDQVISGHADGQVRFTRRGIKGCERLQVHNAAIRSIMITSDERIGVSMDWDDKVVLWMVASRKRLGTLHTGDQPLGNQSADFKGSLWIAKDGSRMSQVFGHREHGLTIRTWHLGGPEHRP